MKVTRDQLSLAIAEGKGIVTAICQKLNISRWAFYKRVNKDQELLEELRSAREELADIAELKLWEKLKEGDIRAILFTLKTIGRDRGFVEKMEIDQTQKQVINIIEVPEMSANEPSIEDIKESEH
jgi:hypothetical protein